MDEMSDDDDDGKTKAKTLIIIVFCYYTFLNLLIENVSKRGCKLEARDQEVTILIGFETQLFDPDSNWKTSLKTAN